MSDPYNGDDKSPFTSNAIKSSCWELATLQTHYLSSVSIMAKIFTEVFTKPEFNMEDFMDHGYGTVSCPFLIFSSLFPGHSPFLSSLAPYKLMFI